MEPSGGKSKLLPENAYRPLKEGEEYTPIVPADQSPYETTARAIVMGCIGVVVFTFAAAYIGLKAGNVIETAIPIAILAVFFGKFFARNNTILENVIVQSIGAASGVVVAGAVFTIPALYILDLPVSFFDIFLSCMIGGFLGVLLIIPLRRYFCRDEHGNLPFPEATATTEILTSGEEGGAGGQTLLIAFGLGFLYDFLIETFHLWSARLSTAKVLLGSLGHNMYDKVRMQLELEATAALFGLGYIIGIKYAAVICAGSVLANLVLVPMVFAMGSGMDSMVSPGEKLISAMSAGEIFTAYVRPIGIGAIAMAGIISILKMGKIIVSSLSLGFKGIFAGSHEEAGETPRTDLEISPKNVVLLELLFVVFMFFIFMYIAGWDLKVAIIGTIVTAVLAFLFTPVAARAIAIVGVNPVSGMTMITLIIACTILAATGLTGKPGQTTVLIIGAAICTALSTSGAFISDLKIGYWIGATPRRQMRWKFLGIVVAAACVGLVIDVLASGYGFVASDAHPSPLPAPQGNLMATIVSSTLVPDAQSPWLLYGMGAAIAIMLEMLTVPALAFALGIYLPMYINLPVFAGGAAAWLLQRRGRNDREKGALKNNGILVASGLVAGAAIAGVLSAVIKTLFQQGLNFSEAIYGSVENFKAAGMIPGLIGLIVLAGLCHYVASASARRQIEHEDAAGQAEE
jgi:putative OPT family oligopeptide transporter